MVIELLATLPTIEPKERVEGRLFTVMDLDSQNDM
jgi:hypothetical protein